jgi:ABC-type nickel/cobalt efflux system permease component RcnA
MSGPVSAPVHKHEHDHEHGHGTDHGHSAKYVHTHDHVHGAAAAHLEPQPGLLSAITWPGSLLRMGLVPRLAGAAALSSLIWLIIIRVLS